MSKNNGNIITYEKTNKQQHTTNAILRKKKGRGNGNLPLGTSMLEFSGKELQQLGIISYVSNRGDGKTQENRMHLSKVK